MTGETFKGCSLLKNLTNFWERSNAHALQGDSNVAQNLQKQRDIGPVVNMKLTFLTVQLWSLAPPPMVPYKPIFFLAKWPAIKRCLALTAPLKLKWPFFSFPAFSIIANLQQNIPFSRFDNLQIHQRPAQPRHSNQGYLSI
jgi:hypothetical protein